MKREKGKDKNLHFCRRELEDRMIERKVQEREQETVASCYCITAKLRIAGRHVGSHSYFSI